MTEHRCDGTVLSSCFPRLLRTKLHGQFLSLGDLFSDLKEWSCLVFLVLQSGFYACAGVEESFGLFIRRDKSTYTNKQKINLDVETHSTRTPDGEARRSSSDVDKNMRQMRAGLVCSKVCASLVRTTPEFVAKRRRIKRSEADSLAKAQAHMDKAMDGTRPAPLGGQQPPEAVS